MAKWKEGGVYILNWEHNHHRFLLTTCNMLLPLFKTHTHTKHIKKTKPKKLLLLWSFLVPQRLSLFQRSWNLKLQQAQIGPQKSTAWKSSEELHMANEECQLMHLTDNSFGYFLLGHKHGGEFQDHLVSEEDML